MTRGLRTLRRSRAATRLVALGYQLVTGKPLPLELYLEMRGAPPRHQIPTPGVPARTPDTFAEILANRSQGDLQM